MEDDLIFFLSFFFKPQPPLSKDRNVFSRFSFHPSKYKSEGGGEKAGKANEITDSLALGSLQLAAKGETDTKLIRNSSLKYLTIESRAAGHVATKG